MNSGPFAILGTILMTTIVPAQTPLRVACVGDSITYGDKLADRDTQSYPAVLASLSGGRFVTGNFGVCGATALSGIPSRSWTDTPECRAALAFNPDLVVVMLGINDLAYPELHGRYPADLRAIVERFQPLPSAPRLFLCTLTPIAPATWQAQANRMIRDTMNPAIRAVAAETGAGLIDASAAFPNRLDLLPDGLHPSPAGAELIARTVWAALDSDIPREVQIQPAPVAGPVEISIRNEARAARHRAEQWLQGQSPPANLLDPGSRENAAELLPLLAGQVPDSNEDLFYCFAALALALERLGQETAFLPDGRPVAWREALLHQLVQRQRIDPKGDGFWSNPDADDPADAVRATTYALQAIATGMRE